MAAGDDEAFVPKAGLRIRTIAVSQEYTEHAFEEYGDGYKTTVEIEMDGRSKTYTTVWYLLQDSPGLT